MPCRPEERSAQSPEPPNPAMPTDSNGNAGAGDAEPDAENSESGSDLDEELPQKRKRPHTVLSYEVVKRWTTGERAELTEDEIKAELAMEATIQMELSGQKKFPCHIRRGP